MGEDVIGWTENPREIVLIEDAYGVMEIDTAELVRLFPDAYRFVGSYVFCGDYVHKFRYIGGPE